MTRPLLRGFTRFMACASALLILAFSASCTSLDVRSRTVDQLYLFTFSRCHPVFFQIGHGPSFHFVQDECRRFGLALSGTGNSYSPDRIRTFSPPFPTDIYRVASRPDSYQFSGSVVLDEAHHLIDVRLFHEDGRAFEFNGQHTYVQDPTE